MPEGKFCPVCDADTSTDEPHNKADHATAWESSMDPDSNLEEQRQLAGKLLADEREADEHYYIDVERLCELVESLDKWIKRGGFLPKEWRDARTAAQGS